MRIVPSKNVLVRDTVTNPCRIIIQRKAKCNYQIHRCIYFLKSI